MLLVRALIMPEPYAGKLVRPVLWELGGGDATRLTCGEIAMNLKVVPIVNFFLFGFNALCRSHY